MRASLLAAVLAAAVLDVPVSADRLPVASPESVGLSSERLERLARAIRAEVDRGRVPGAVVAVARRGRLAYYEAFGYRDPGAKVAMPKDAIFPLASMTKPFAAVATLMLAEEGTLLLNDPIGTVLPALANLTVQTATGVEPARRQPTLQDMLRHTAGVSYGNRGDSPLHRLYGQRVGGGTTQTADEFLQALAGLPLFYHPGTAWEYSYGIDVAGLAVEAVTRQRLGAFLQERLFGPLGMTDTAFAQPADKAARFAKAFARDPDTGQPIADRPVDQAAKFDCGGGCASGTALDYLQFASMLLNKGVLGGTRVLGRKSVEFMTADQLGAGVDRSRLHEFAVEHMDGFGFGLGVAVRTQPGIAGVPGSAGEFLWSGAQGTMFWVDPREELAVVFMARTPGPVRRHYRQLVKNLVVQALVD
ncbi:MAG: serine hydrolase domain-containing protein [Vicinamibacterales bacterium]